MANGNNDGHGKNGGDDSSDDKIYDVGYGRPRKKPASSLVAQAIRKAGAKRFRRFAK